MIIAATVVYDLGPYRIVRKPCPTNPAWPTHWIYRGDKLISKSLSVPSLEDCQHLERWGEQYATNSHTPTQTLRGAALGKHVKATST